MALATWGSIARMAEQEDAWDLKSQEEIREGSIPSVSTDRSMV